LESIGTPTFWIAFNAFVVAMLALDLFVVHRDAHAVSVREATFWSVVWIGIAVLFGAGVWHVAGADKGLEFYTGYLIEKSLSVDNLFVFLVVFRFFRVDPAWQHRVLFWGIFGAIVLRAAFIFAGVALLQTFSWTMFVFGALLVATGVKMAIQDDDHFDPAKSRILRLVRKFVPMSHDYDGDRFFTIEDGKRIATPLFAVLVFIEASDVMFAVDSIPAIFGVTTDPFIVYTSNILAILGLRSLYFVLARMLDGFAYLKYGLAVVLVFVGIKMIIEPWVHIPVVVSLGVVAVCIAGSIVLSRFAPAPAEGPDDSQETPP
jgi:tellurite resistance protein TerC